MKEVLKTLKDLEEDSLIFTFLTEYQLKKEAIKWYKFYDKEYQEQINYRKNHLKSSVKGIYEQCLDSKLGFIKDFFDLSKEDLK